jgi:hypothetical protein
MRYGASVIYHGHNSLFLWWLFDFYLLSESIIRILVPVLEKAVAIEGLDISVNGRFVGVPRSSFFTTDNLGFIPAHTKVQGELRQMNKFGTILYLHKMLGSVCHSEWIAGENLDNCKYFDSLEAGLRHVRIGLPWSGHCFIQTRHRLKRGFWCNGSRASLYSFWSQSLQSPKFTFTEWVVPPICNSSCRVLDLNVIVLHKWLLHITALSCSFLLYEFEWWHPSRSIKKIEMNSIIMATWEIMAENSLEWVRVVN